MLRKEKTLTETNVLYLRWLFSRHAMDANVKVLLNDHENSNKDLAMDLNLCIHLQPLNTPGTRGWSRLRDRTLAVAKNRAKMTFFSGAKKNYLKKIFFFAYIF